MTRRGIVIAALAVFTAGLAPANYHFVHYANSGPPYTPIFERFQVESLRGGVVPFLIVDPPSSLQLASGDTFTSVVSQIRAASEVWNAVPTSTFRFQFGGMATPNVTMTSPAVVISFDEVPPGVIAMAGPVTTGQITTLANGQQLVPILQSSMVIGPDLRSPGTSSTGIGPSWSDRLFLTLVHEFGHTLGLQHTWTSSAMSTEITRATTKAHPLGADDIAAISILYPTPDWAGLYGSITGQVTLGGSGVALASVVALTPGGDAVSTLTNPDGTYEIDGLSAGSYQVYVHTVPPSLAGESYSGDVIPPIGSQGTIQAGPPFNTIFQSGTASPGGPVVVSAGNATAGVDFAVTPRSSVNIYGVQAYTFLWDQIAQAYDTAKPATFILGSGTGTAVVTGDGLFASDGINPASGLSVAVLGAPGMIQSPVEPYTYGAGFLQFLVSTASQSAPGPQHLILSQAGEMEIVPSAISLVAAAPPAITSVQQNNDGTANIFGSGIGPGTRILFDGAAAAVQQAGSGQLTVVAPPALPGANAAVIAINPGGLDSNFFAPAAPPPLYAYGAGQPLSIQLTPASAPAGAKLLLDITGTNVNFAAANLQFGFGSSDIAVLNMWAISPQHAVAQVAISKSAQLGPMTVTLSSGLQFLEIPAGFQVTTSEPEPLAVSAFENTFEPGGVFVLCVAGTPPFATSRDFTVTISGPNGDEGAFIFFYIPGPILFLYAPLDLPPGPVLVKVSYRGAPLAPMIFIVGAPVWPNIVQAAAASSGLAYSEANPAFPGDTVALTVQSLADSLAPMDVSSITVSVGGVAQTVTFVQQNNSTDTATVRFQLSPQTAVPATGNLPLTVAYDGRVSPPVTLPIGPQ